MQHNFERGERSPTGTEVGLQPLDAILSGLGLQNHDIVAAAPANTLTHKMVAKARRGRAITRRAQDKIVAALNAKSSGTVYQHKDCLTYSGR